MTFPITNNSAPEVPSASCLNTLRPFPGFSVDHSRLAREYLRLSEAERTDEADAIFEQLDGELGDKTNNRLFKLAEEEAERKPVSQRKAENSAPETTTEAESFRDPLPYPEMNHDKHPDLTGYFIDADARLREPAIGKGRRGRVLRKKRYWNRSKEWIVLFLRGICASPRWEQKEALVSSDVYRAGTAQSRAGSPG